MDQRMRDKLGLSGAHEGDRALVEDLLQAMQKDRVDYTVLWRRLSVAVRESGGSTHAFEPVRDLFLHRDVFDAWCVRYLERLGSGNRQTKGDAMLRINPKYSFFFTDLVASAPFCIIPLGATIKSSAAMAPNFRSQSGY